MTSCLANTDRVIISTLKTNIWDNHKTQMPNQKAKLQKKINNPVML